MKSQIKEKNNSRLTYFLISGISIALVAIITLLFKVSYLEAKNTFEKSGQAPAGRIQSVTASDYIQGNPQARVTLVEYSDFECPQCQYFHPTLTKLLSYYGNSIRLISRRYPLPQNQNAEKEAEAALCVGKLGGNKAFWQFSERIFDKITPTEGGTGLPLSLLPEFAKQVGIDTNSFQQCLDSGNMAQRVQLEQSDGEQGGVHQLPGTFVIDSKGHMILLAGNQSFEVMKTVIDQALAL